MRGRSRSHYEEALLPELRKLVTGQGRPDREKIAKETSRYARATLLKGSRHWRFGFRDSLSDIAQGIADEATALLLKEVPLGGGSASWPLTKAMRRAVEQAPTSTEDEMAEALCEAWRRIVTSKTRQRHHRAWCLERPEQARIQRILKRCIRDTDGLRIYEDRRGKFLIGDASDLCRPAIGSLALETDLHAHGTVTDPKAAIERMRDLVTPSAIHGGYCYIMDLVRALEAARVSLWFEGTPSETRSRIARSGLPETMLLERFRDSLRDLAWDIVRRTDEKRARRGKLSPAVDIAGKAIAQEKVVHARVEVAVEMACRGLGVGDPCLCGYSQQALVAMWLQQIVAEDQVREISHRTNHVVRQLREELERWIQRMAASRDGAHV